MPFEKQIRDLTFSWTWQGDKEALMGFNVALCKTGILPTQGAVQTAYVSKSSTILSDPVSGTYTFTGVLIEPNTNYTPWAQAVYAGDDSDWINSSSVSAADDGNYTIPTKQSVLSAQASANNALSQLLDIASDSKITQGEKQDIFREWKQIYDEKSLITSQATSAGVQASTEATNYNSSYTALSSYLTGSPISIEAVPVSGITWVTNINPITINGAEFRAKFADYYSKRQVLLNKILDSTPVKKLSDGISLSSGGIDLQGTSYIKSTLKSVSGSGTGLLFGFNTANKTIFNVGTGGQGTSTPHIHWSEATSALEVVGNIKMGEGSTISWGNVTTSGTPPSDISNDALKINPNLVTNSTFSIGTTIADSFGIYNNSPVGEPSTAEVVQTGGVDGGPFQRISWTVGHTQTKGIYGSCTTLWKANATYTVSFYAKTSNLQTFGGMFLNWNIHPATTNAISNPNLSTSWQRYIFTITWGATVEANGTFYISVHYGTGNGNIELDHLKIEEGSICTPWMDGAPKYLTSTKITQTTIESPTINAGTINSVNINGSTITGSTLQTSSGTGKRFSVDSESNEAKFYDESNTLRAQIGIVNASSKYTTLYLNPSPGHFGLISKGSIETEKNILCYGHIDIMPGEAGYKSHLTLFPLGTIGGAPSGSDVSYPSPGMLATTQWTDGNGMQTALYFYGYVNNVAAWRRII